MGLGGRGGASDTVAGRGMSPADTVSVIGPDGAGPVVLACEHASRFIPQEFAGLGLDDAALGSHIAWDPGALPVARLMAERLDAPLVAQNVSRLVYDCNRPPEAPSAMPARSEVHDIPGNSGLTEAERRRRTQEYYVPFVDALSSTLDRVSRAGPPVLVTIHTFTPVYAGVRRDVEIGILHDTDARLADAILAECAQDRQYEVRRNEPYGPEDGVTHTLIVQALPHEILNVMIEVRNDLVADEAGQRDVASYLLERLGRALAALSGAATAPEPVHAATQ